MLFIFILPALILLALFTYVRPQTATLLLVALTPAYLIKFSVAAIPTNLFEISVLVIFSFSLAQHTVRRQWQKALRQMPSWVMLLIALFALSSIISTFISPHPKTSLGILKGWIFVPLLAGWLVYAFSLADKTNNFHARALRSLVLSGLAVSLVGLTQINQLDRVRSIYDVSNSLALFVAPLLVIAFYLTITGHKKVFFLFSTIIMSSALIATQSASGITAAAISMLVGTIVYYFSKWRHKGRKSLIPGLGLLTLFVIASLSVITTTGRLSYLVQPQNLKDSHNSISVRLQLWSISLELIKEHPLLGIGLGTFEPAYQQILHARFSQFNNCGAPPRTLQRGLSQNGAPPQATSETPRSPANSGAKWGRLLSKNCAKPLAEFVYRDPHNWPLSLWLNTGLIGLFSFALINIVIMCKAVAQLRSTPRNPNHIFITATILALMSLLLFGLTDTIYWKNDLAALHWILIALLISINAKTKDYSLISTG